MTCGKYYARKDNGVLVRVENIINSKICVSELHTGRMYEVEEKDLKELDLDFILSKIYMYLKNSSMGKYRLEKNNLFVSCLDSHRPEDKSPVQLSEIEQYMSELGYDYVSKRNVFVLRGHEDCLKMFSVENPYYVVHLDSVYRYNNKYYFSCGLPLCDGMDISSGYLYLAGMELGLGKHINSVELVANSEIEFYESRYDWMWTYKIYKAPDNSIGIILSPTFSACGVDFESVFSRKCCREVYWLNSVVGKADSSSKSPLRTNLGMLSTRVHSLIDTARDNIIKVSKGICYCDGMNEETKSKIVDYVKTFMSVSKLKSEIDVYFLVPKNGTTPKKCYLQCDKSGNLSLVFR